MHTFIRTLSGVGFPFGNKVLAAATSLLTLLSVVAVPAVVASPASASTTPNRSVPVENFEENLWGLAVIGARDAWKVTRGRGVIVAVIDTGVDGTHADLNGRVLAGRSTVANESFAADTNSDAGGHGTHVAGIIAAAANSSGVVGVAPEATILPVQVLGAGGTGSDRSVADGIDWAVANGAKVINLSLGGETNPFAVDASRSCAAVGRAFDAGVVVVVSAGNDGAAGNPKSEPASCRGALSVTAVDEDLNRSYFSSFDATVGVSAPGSAIISSVPTDERYPFAQWNGTSMAAPYVAGAAALIRAAHPQWSAQQVVTALTSSATDLGPSGTDPEFGAGLLNVAAAVTGTSPATSRDQLLAAIGSASVPTITNVTADGKTVSVRWISPRNVRAAAIASYRIELFAAGEGNPLTAAANLMSTFDVDSGNSAVLTFGKVPAAVRVTANAAEVVSGARSRVALPFFDIQDNTPTSATTESTTVTSATAVWTDAGVKVTFVTVGPAAPVGLTLNAGAGEYFTNRIVDSTANVQIFPFPADSPVRGLNIVIGVATGVSSQYASLRAQYLVKITALTAGKKYVSFIGSTKEACNSKAKTGCAGTEVTLHDAKTGKVVARTWVLGNMRYGFDIPRGKAPVAVYVSTGKTRSMTVTTASGATR